MTPVATSSLPRDDLRMETGSWLNFPVPKVAMNQEQTPQVPKIVHEEPLDDGFSPWLLVSQCRNQRKRRGRAPFSFSVMTSPRSIRVDSDLTQRDSEDEPIHGYMELPSRSGVTRGKGVGMGKVVPVYLSRDPILWYVLRLMGHW